MTKLSGKRWVFVHVGIYNTLRKFHLSKLNFTRIKTTNIRITTRVYPPVFFQQKLIEGYKIYQCRLLKKVSIMGIYPRCALPFWIVFWHSSQVLQNIFTSAVTLDQKKCVEIFF